MLIQSRDDRSTGVAIHEKLRDRFLPPSVEAPESTGTEAPELGGYGDLAEWRGAMVTWGGRWGGWRLMVRTIDAVSP